MKGLAFQLSGKTACFRKPDVNSSVYMTYNNIHKVALLGLLGAIIGLDGHGEQYWYNRTHKDKLTYPEFYQVLNKVKVAIIPKSENKQGYFTKKLQTFNNSVGYASKEEGGNLIVREYWLENPNWDIYLMTDEENILNTLADYLLNNKTVYTPYLGKNDHLADIYNSREINFIEVKDFTRIDSLVPLDIVSSFAESRRGEEPFMYKEMLPVGRTENLLYDNKMFVYTNQKVEEVNDISSFYETEDKILYMI